MLGGGFLGTMTEVYSAIDGLSWVLPFKSTAMEEALLGKYQAHSTQAFWGLAVYDGTEV